MEQEIMNKLELIESIKRHNRLYRMGTPEISDVEYDNLVERLKQTDPDNEWFHHIEPSEIINSSRKRALPIPMKSLNKVKSVVELKKWADSLGLGENVNLVCMPKYDGLSLLIDTKTWDAFSRGGSENEGMLCSEHLKKIALNFAFRFRYIYGELVFSTQKWKGFKDNPENGEYKSPRNTIGGLINKDEASDLLGYTSFVPYGASEWDIKDHRMFSEVLNELQGPAQYECMTLKDCTSEKLSELYKKWRTEYYIDGIVVYVDNLHVWNTIGRHKTTGNPLYAVAYKHPDFTDAFETTVKDVFWGMSKAGALKPVVNIEAVDTGDCQMENPTGYNASWIKEHHIAPGAKILVTRSGGVIPKILETLVPAENTEAFWQGLEKCPYCGSPTHFSESGVELMCSDSACKERIFQEILFFFTTCGINNMGEEALRKIYDSGKNSIEAILNITAEELYWIDGFGDSMVNVVLDNMRNIKKGVSLPVLMHASNCFVGIGQTKAKAILKKMSAQQKEDLINGILQEESDGSVTMGNFYAGVKPFGELLQRIKVPVLNEAETNTNGKLSGYKICFSGFRNNELQKQIEESGGSVVSSVSKNTSILVVTDKNATSSKISKAELLGVKIMDLSEFNEFVVK